MLLEKNPVMTGRGVAYSEEFTHQLLNVTTGGMSLFTEKPNDFTEWLERNRNTYSNILPEKIATAFVPRKFFGDYISQHLREAVHSHPGKLQIINEEVISLRKKENIFLAVTDRKNIFEADEVVLALGNFPPADLFKEEHPVFSDPRYFSNPWIGNIYTGLSEVKNILVAGTGLSAVDVVLTLKQKKFNGNIRMISRKGKLPLAHDVNVTPVKINLPPHLHPREVWLHYSNFLKTHPEISWQSLVEGLRPLTQNFWTNWNKEERNYFLKRLRPSWEIVRHRIPHSASVMLNEMIASGKLQMAKGMIANAKIAHTGISVSFDSKSKLPETVFQKIVNCTGPESDYRKVKFPIIISLMEQGFVCADELGLGIKCTVDGKIIDKNSNEVEGLWCIGPMRKSALWETTALKEIREQAEVFVKRF